MVGFAVSAAGMASAILGILYALIEPNLKRMLAYSTIENAGIILAVLGGRMVFRSYGRPALAAAAALAACLFHIFNHAVLAVIGLRRRGGTRHGDAQYGTHGRYDPPHAANCAVFSGGGDRDLIALPPYRFVSEWLIYQALLGGFGSTASLTRIVFPAVVLRLALTGALAAACFVRAFGIGFLALPRSSQATHAHEAHSSMLAGMGVLAALCIALGLGATLWIPVLTLVSQLVNTNVSGNLIRGGRLPRSPRATPRADSIPSGARGRPCFAHATARDSVGSLVASRR